MGIMQIIREYTNQIVEGNFDAAEGVCEKCHEKPGEYKLHECRKRQVRFSVGAVVEIAMTFVLRWKCSLCGATFTQYPPFIAPYKRFALHEIVRLSRKYLENDKSSYADAVVEDGNEIGYPGIGGLLATVDPETAEVYYHFYGPNGNTAQLLSDKGEISAHYEYDPFGNIQFQYGPYAEHK